MRANPRQHIPDDGLWDHPANVFPGLEPAPSGPAWDRERLTTPAAGGTQVQKLLRTVEQALSRAESLAPERPATAAALADQVLRDLDELSFAREAASRGA